MFGYPDRYAWFSLDHISDQSSELVYLKNLCFLLHLGLQTLRVMPNAFICFLMFGKADETLARVFKILNKKTMF